MSVSDFKYPILIIGGFVLLLLTYAIKGDWDGPSGDFVGIMKYHLKIFMLVGGGWGTVWAVYFAVKG